MPAYTPEQTEMMVERYKEAPSRETVKELALELEKSERSITSKLAREGVYRKQEYRTKTGEKPITKADLSLFIGATLGCRENRMMGFEKADRLSLVEVWERLKDQAIELLGAGALEDPELEKKMRKHLEIEAEE